MREDLSFTKKVDNFWTKFSVRIQKTDTFLRDGIVFNLADPYENLQVRVLRANREIAPSYDLRDAHPMYKFYLAEENEENIDWFVSRHKDCAVKKIFIGKQDNLMYNKNGSLTILPNENMDGFFVAKLEKR